MKESVIKTSRSAPLRTCARYTSSSLTWRKSKMRRMELTAKYSSTRRASIWWNFLILKLCFLERSHVQSRNQRPNGRNSEKREDFLHEGSVPLWCSMRLHKIGCQDGVPRVSRRSKTRPNGRWSTSQNTTKLGLIHSLMQSKRRKLHLRSRNWPSWRTKSMPPGKERKIRMSRSLAKVLQKLIVSNWRMKASATRFASVSKRHWWRVSNLPRCPQHRWVNSTRNSRTNQMPLTHRSSKRKSQILIWTI